MTTVTVPVEDVAAVIGREYAALAAKIAGRKLLPKTSQQKRGRIGRTFSEADFAEQLSKSIAAALAAAPSAPPAPDADMLSGARAVVHEWKHVITRVQRLLNDSLPFIQKQFHEHIEKVVESGKAEIEAYASARLREIAGQNLQLGHGEYAGEGRRGTPHKIEEKK